MLVCTFWALALALAKAFLPLLDQAATRMTHCVLWSSGPMASLVLGILPFFWTVVGATNLISLCLHFFIHDRRKIRPESLVPAVTHVWTYHSLVPLARQLPTGK